MSILAQKSDVRVRAIAGNLEDAVHHVSSILFGDTMVPIRDLGVGIRV